MNNDYAIQPGALGRYQGGDWLGIQDHLDYLQALGVTTLWISPVVVNVDTDAGVDGYHGYWADDLTQPNKYMGDLASLRSMVAAAHDVRDEGRARHRVQPHGPGLLLRHEPERPARRLHREATARRRPSPQINEFDPDCEPARRSSLQLERSRRARADASSSTIRRSTASRRKPGILGTAAAVSRLRAHPRLHASTTRCSSATSPAGSKDLATELPEVRATLVDAYREVGRVGRLRRLPDRHDQARRVRVLADVRPCSSHAPRRRRGRATSSCSARRSTATTPSSAATRARDARQHVLFLPALHGVRRASSRTRTSGRRSKRGRADSDALGCAADELRDDAAEGGRRRAERAGAGRSGCRRRSCS